MKTLETLANEILHKLTFETHKSTTQIVVEGLIEAQKLVKLCNISHVVNSVACDFCGQPAMESKTHCEKCACLRVIWTSNGL